MRSVLSALAFAVCSAVLFAQVPGRNVNMVSGRTLPDGDPFLQRQNEPSIAASTRNPLHLLAGANDYRTVDLPGLPTNNETGDAWMGVFKSYDGGNTWRSTLIPGYPQDASSTSPLRAYRAAADPVVRAGSNGLFYYSGIVFDRSQPAKSALFVSRFIDNNNQEAGDPILFLDTKLITTNPGTAFIDKPWFAVDIPRANAPTCAITTSQRSPTQAEPNRVVTSTQRFPGGATYAAFSLITGEDTDTRSQVYLSRSLDCGATWSTPQQISSSLDPINQGATLAIDPRNGSLYLAWRRFSADGTDDSIMVTRSVDQGRKWDPPGRARRFPRGRKLGLSSQMHGKTFKQPIQLAELASLDQPTTGDQFRTNAYPTMAIDGAGRVYVAWSERGFAQSNPDADDGDARILLASSLDGTTWTAPTLVANDMLPGHQVMPSLSFAGGKLMIAYYDFHEDVSNVFGKFVNESDAVLSAHKRHTVDVRAAMAPPAATPAFGASVRVSEYLRGSRPGYGQRDVEQLQFNPPNLKLFRTGSVPFFGDYIDLAPSPSMVPTAAGGWAFNTAAVSSPLFHVAWTDNRDVVPPANGDWATYTPPGSTGAASSYDSNKSSGPCIAGQEGMRNQNIYSARITGGLVAGSPGNTKPLSAVLPRAFVVFAQNATDVVRVFRFTVENQPVGGRASFLQTPLPPYTQTSPAPLTVLDVIVPRRSTVVRNVYATSTDPHAQINVSVKEVGAVNGTATPGGLQSTIVLNPDISNPDISNPDISNPDISNPDISNAEVSNPDISNPDISNPDISNPDISNPDISNPDISNGSVANPDISNPDISNPDISNPDISNPDISNPDISNPDISNQSMQDTTWTVTNNGNTTSAYSVKLLLNGSQPAANQVAVQLILRKVYTTPFALNCTLSTQAHNVLLANINNPTFTPAADVNNPDISNPDISNATLWLAPGETAKLTLRVLDLDITDGITFTPATQVTPAVVSQARDVVLDGAGGVVLSNDEPIAFPPTSNLQLQFLDVPKGVALGNEVGTIRVRVTDPNGATVPGAAVSVSVHAIPGDTQVTPTTVVTTDATGEGTILVRTLPVGTYHVRGSASSADHEPIIAYSNTFTVVSQTGLIFLVTNTASSGTGSLLQAMQSANASPGPDTIRFNLGVGVHTINLTRRLPSITDPVTIDGRPAQSCDGSAPVVEISGAVLDFTGPGLLVTAGGTTLRGLSITGFAGNGIEMRTGGGNHVECSYVGLAPDGTTAKPNAGNGIQLIDSAANTLGGSGLLGNVISANNGEGIRVDGAAATGNIIQGNFIGTDASGTLDRGNAASGVYLRHAPGNAVLGNTVSGNNGFAGIAICGNLNFCGGAPDVALQPSTAAANVVQGNFVGTNSNGANLGNAGIGISIDSAPNTLIGLVPVLDALPTGSPNFVSFNGSGVRVFGVGAINNRISQNRISGNTGLGIDLEGDGVTANDRLDLDGGSNNRQNFPAVVFAEKEVDGTSVFQGTLSSTPNTPFVIELFHSPTCHASGNGEGAVWFGSISGISTDGSGDLIFSASFGATSNVPNGSVVTATATDPDGNTSEFSRCKSVDAATAPVTVGTVGGNGGTAFGPFSCAPGSVATALRGRAGENIDRTELWCTPLIGGGASFAGGVGGGGGADYETTLTCAPGSAITGLQGQAGLVTFAGGGQATVVDTLGVLCTSPNGTTVASPQVATSNGAPAFTLACPVGKKVVSIFGRQGALLDQIGISCK